MRAALVTILLCLLTLPLLFSTAAFAQTAGQPDEATVLAQADAMCAQGHYDQAVTLFTQAIGCNPGDAKAYRGRGWAYGHLGKYDVAIADETTAMQLDPNSSLAASIAQGENANPSNLTPPETPEKPCTIHFETSQKLIFVKVQIGNGQIVNRFLFDTGSDATIISETLANQLHLETIASNDHGMTDAFGASGKIALCKIDSLTVGNCCFRHPLVTVMNLSPLESSMGEELDGIIGASFLRDYRVTVNYPNQTITLARPTSALTETDVMKAVGTVKYGKLAIPITVDGQPLSGVIDTGANETVLPLDFLQTLPNDHEDKISCIGSGAAGLMGKSDIQEVMLRLNHLDFGAYHLQKYPVGTLVCDKAVIGADILAQFVVTLDYPNRMVALTPIANQHFDDNEASFGLNADPSPQGLAISGIWENSAAAKAGLQPGDLILKINGQQIDKSSVAKLNILDDDDNVTTLDLLIQSQGITRPVTLKKAKLLPPIPSADTGTH